jgi:hypothetical protein
MNAFWRRGSSGQVESLIGTCPICALIGTLPIFGAFDSFGNGKVRFSDLCLNRTVLHG